jgi:hypothetical protein
MLIDRKGVMVKRLDDLKRKSREEKEAARVDVKALQAVISDAEGVEGANDAATVGTGEERSEESEEDAKVALSIVVETDDLDYSYCEEKEYLDYLTDSDVEAYLNGILWVRSFPPLCISHSRIVGNARRSCACILMGGAAISPSPTLEDLL